LATGTFFLLGLPVQVMSVNARSVFLCLKHQIPFMLETAAGHGAIVITSSVAGENSSG
jgi:NAD(P)-dependent dehydrogenase (short-subunit alcohol dehydrogenase family)